MIAAVKPRYGRIVMFRGIIPHSARPPSPEYHGARYTFACKVLYRLANKVRCKGFKTPSGRDSTLFSHFILCQWSVYTVIKWVKYFNMYNQCIF